MLYIVIDVKKYSLEHKKRIKKSNEKRQFKNKRLLIFVLFRLLEWT